MNFKSVISTIVVVFTKFTAIDFSEKVNTENYISTLEPLIYPVVGLLIGMILFASSMLHYIYSPIFSGLVTLLLYFLVTKGKNFSIFILFLEKYINKHIIKEETTSLDAYIPIIMILSYFCMFTVSTMTTLLIAPIIAYSITCTVPIMIKISSSTSNIIKNCGENKMYSYSGFLISFIIPMVINTRLIIAVAILYIFLMYIIKNKILKTHKVPYNFESVLIEGLFVSFLLLSYVLFL